MPTVRLTKKLVKSIISNAEKVTMKQILDLPELSAKEGKTILLAFVEEHSLQPSPAEYLNSKITQVDIENIKCEGDENHTFSFTVPMTKMIAPQSISYSDHTLEFDLDMCSYRFPEKHWSIIYALLRKRISIETQCQEFNTQIVNLLGRCTTIKQFIEAWPQGEQFIPSWDLQKHYEQEKKTRKRGVYLQDEELQNLNSLLLTSKIT